MNEKLTLLLVDDTDALRAGTAGILHQASYYVEEAETGTAALEKAQSPCPDLVLLDVNPPDSHGFKICQTLKRRFHNPSISVRMLSARRTSADDRSEGLEIGADGYLVRPLQKALANIKVLKGLLPICSNCKKIREDQGYRKQGEVYLREHAEVDFSHGLCPDCLRKLYPEYADRILNAFEPSSKS